MVVNDTAVRKEYKQECWNQEVTIQKFLFHKELSGSLWNKLVKTSLLHNVVFHCGISYGEDVVFRRKHDPSQGRCVIRYAVHRPLLFSNPIGIFSSPHACRPSWRPVPLPVKDAVPAIRVQDAPHD